MLAHPAMFCSINTDLDVGDRYRYRTKMSTRKCNVALNEPQHHVIDPADLRGTLNNRIKHRLHVRGRATDNAQHLGRCRLMLQGFAQFRVAFLDLLEQSHVLNGDDSLISEGFEKFDLFFSKRSNFLAADCDHSDRNTLSQQWRTKCSSHPRNWLSGLIVGELRQLCCNVMNVYRLAVDHGSAGGGPPIKRAPPRLPNRPHSIYGHALNHVSIDTMNQSIARITQPRCIFCDYIEHRLDIRRRTGNHAQYFTRRGLLFQRLLEFLEKSHVLNSDDRLVGEDFEESYLLLGEWTDLCSANDNGPDWIPFTK